jgi:hypothetical protein
MNTYLHRQLLTNPGPGMPFNLLAFEDYSRNLLRLCPTEEELKREICRSRLGTCLILRAGVQNDINLIREGALLLEQVSFCASRDDPLVQLHLGAGYASLYATTMLCSQFRPKNGPSIAYSQSRPGICLQRHLGWNPPPPTDWGFVLDVAIDSITRFAGLEGTVAKSHQLLQELPSELPCIVTALIADGGLPKALESLERVRGFVWSQLSSLRTLMDDLRSRNPSIANRLEFLSRGLEIAGGSHSHLISSLALSQPGSSFLDTPCIFRRIAVLVHQQHKSNCPRQPRTLSPL